jgi:hypothetical protein
MSSRKKKTHCFTVTNRIPVLYNVHRKAVIRPDYLQNMKYTILTHYKNHPLLSSWRYGNSFSDLYKTNAAGDKKQFLNVTAGGRCS